MTALDHSLDSILVQLGELGTYQILMLIALCWGTTLHGAARIAYVFTAMDLEYRCEVSECETNGEFEPPWLREAVPYEDDTPSKCLRYVKDNSTVSFNCSNYTTTIEKCDRFVYKTEEDSILKAYGLHCYENRWKLALVGTINNAGQFFGMFVAGVVSDRFGRKILFVVGLTMCGVFGVLRTFIQSYIWFVVFEFVDAAFGAGTHVCGYIMGAELVGPNRRVLCGTLVNICSSYGSIYAGAFAWLFQAWKPLIYSIYGPLVLIVVYFWLLPESVRWNLSKGRLTEAKNTLRQVSKINRKIISEEALDELNIVESETASRVFDIFKSRTLVLRLINCCFCWMTCGFVFYGLTLNSVSLAGNSYLDFMLTSVVEIPSLLTCVWFADRFGRKWTLSGSLILAGVCCFAFIFIPAESYVGSLVVFLLGKFAVTTAFVVMYVVTSELFPTPLRHSMMGACSTFGRVGSIAAPQTPLLAQIWAPLLMILFTSMALLSGLLTLLLPETRKIKLPDTIEEACSIGKREEDWKK